jgi:hypothetical protein
VLRDGDFAYEMDNGAVIRVKISIGADRRSATVDFTGTSAQLPSNFNAPSAVVYAAVLYVFRTLVDDDIPLNAGCLKPLEVIVPEGSMLNPRPPAATVAGNVETSQCLTDALYGALGVMAASYGTMNNFTFGSTSPSWLPRRMVFSDPQSSEFDATISDTAMPAPIFLQRLRKGRSVTPAMGATMRLFLSWTVPIFTFRARSARVSAEGVLILYAAPFAAEVKFRTTRAGALLTDEKVKRPYAGLLRGRHTRRTAPRHELP